MKEKINGTGRALYGAAIVLLSEGKTMIAAAIFLIAIVLILISLKDEEAPNYIAMLLKEITVAVAAASLVELVLGNITAVAILVLIMFASNKLQAFLQGYFVKK